MGWLSSIGQMGSELGQAKENVAHEKRTNQRQDLDDALSVFRAQMEQRRIDAEEARYAAAQSFNERKLKDTEDYHKRQTDPINYARKQAAVRVMGDPEAEWDDLSLEQKKTSAGFVDRLAGAAPIGSQSKIKVKDPKSPTGYSWAWYNTVDHTVEGDVVPGAPASNDPNEPTARLTYKTVAQPDGSTKLVPVIEETMKGADAAAQLSGKTPTVGAGGVGAPGMVPTPTARPALRPAPTGASPQTGVGPKANVTGSVVANSPLWRKATTLSDDEYAKNAYVLQHGGTWADATKGLKGGAEQGFRDYLTRKGIPVPSKSGGGNSQAALVGLGEIENALWVGSKNAPPLSKTVEVFDSPKSNRDLMIAWTLSNQGGKTSHSMWSKLSPELLDNYLAKRGVARLSPEEKSYFYGMQQAVSVIQGLRQFTGNPRYTEALAQRYIRELPDPITTNSKADAQQKLERLRNEVNVAKQILSGGGDIKDVLVKLGEPLPPEGSTTPNAQQPLPE
jgi:hypothetical protein